MLWSNCHCLAMNQLPQSTIRLLTSTQAVTGVNSIVKELLENSVDANASSVEIKLVSSKFDQRNKLY